ncbi:MAG: hypothetical protein HY365_02340 [Candidatus Aenigmarchaeota archaeon]|nr:hypothetical protein [Candidatus Aenigmarchaeota archaeon]
MTYKVGISSGWWKIGKDPSLLGIGTKTGAFGATLGVQFNQVDLDTVIEFLEPGLQEYVHRVKEKLGMQIGLHGEIGEIVAFESAERIRWEQSHERLCRTMRGAADLGFIYVNFHLSNSQWLSFHERELRPFGYTYQVVAPTGQPFGEWTDDLLKKDKNAATVLKDWLKDNIRSGRVIMEFQGSRSFQEAFRKLINEEISEEKQRLRRNAEADPAFQKLSEQEKKRAIEIQERTIENSEEIRARAENRLRREGDILFDAWKDSEKGKYTLEAGEIDAYMGTAVYMIASKNPLWIGIVGNDYSSDPVADANRAYIERQREFNAAVSAFYLLSHFTTKSTGHLGPGKDYNKNYIEGTTIKEWCEKKKVKLLLECPQSGEGTEGIARFFHPLHAYYLIKEINSPAIQQCIDFEQEMGQNINLDEELPKLPDDFGSQVFLLHLGDPIPYFGTAHIPIALADRGADALYRWIYWFRNKGFKDGYIIFERGGGRTPGNNSQQNVFEYSVYVIRQIVKYLDQDTKPDKLPPEFYGLSSENKDVFTRQLVAMRDHAWDPLEGLLRMPEEKHTFLGKTAVEGGKAKEWERGRHR